MADMTLPDLPSGVYRHYKGPLYLVLGYGHDANDADRTVVIYVGLQLDEAHAGPRLAVRTADDFFALVHEDGVACDRIGRGSTWCSTHRTTVVPRFTYLGPSYEGAIHD